MNTSTSTFTEDFESVTKILEKLDPETRNKVMDLTESLIMIVREMKALVAAAVMEPVTKTVDKVSPVESFIDYTTEALPKDMFTKIHAELKTLNYTSQGEDRPSIYLFGNKQYIYNHASASVHPTPIEASPLLCDVVTEVNKKLKCDFNSVLVNKYGNLNTKLSFHKDDEPALDPSAPIATLSFGAHRRFQISADEDKSKTIHSVDLSPNSLCVMLPGFQEKFYHQLAQGRNSFKREKGMRFSLTFRKLKLDTPSPAPETVPAKLDPTATEHTESAHTPEKYDAVVLGSSLVKGLDKSLLSKYGKSFKVLPHPGAHIKDITKDTSSIHDIRCEDVNTVFLVCGGNDIQNLPPNESLDPLYNDFTNLFKCAKEKFPNAKIHAVSVIPRKIKHGIPHVNRMWDVNDWLRNHCVENNMRFVDIFSFFLTNDHRFLQEKLYAKDKIHFSQIGNSILGKVLIAVTHRPYA